MIKVYSRSEPFCAYCLNLKRFLQSRNIKFEEIDVSHPSGMRELTRKMPQARAVPQVFDGDKYIGGYQEAVKYFNSKSQE